MFCTLLAVIFLLFTSAISLRYDAAEVLHNLNQNETAVHSLEYWGQWDNHTYYESPENWRFPFYSLFLDRFVNGDPTNDNINGTAWEQDPTSTILRHGGDVKGLQDSLDYLHGLGIRGIYIAGSPFINVPWAADAYSPLDHTLLDKHFGTIQQYRDVITAIHDKGMWVVMENTMSTLGDLLAFEGYLNTSTPWNFEGYNTIYKTSRQYHDYHPSDSWNEHCEYPRFWDQYGLPYNDANTSRMVGCRAGDFDQYGEVSAFGEYPEHQKQLSKFAFVQDRLSEWKPSVLDRIIHFSCITIAMLDIDGFRIDKGLQVTVDAQANFSLATRECARRYGKNNFIIPGEVVNGNLNAAIYIGRGKEPSMSVPDLQQAVSAENAFNESLFIRELNYNALDAAAFHYTTYRGLQRFLGLDGKLSATGEAPINFVDQWHEVQTNNDFINPSTGKYDPRHMYGVSNQDVFRWPGITQGTEKQLLGMFVTVLEMPGIPMVSWGEEQAFYALDNTASNYVFGRQSMTSSRAWQMHGCYYVGNVNIYEMPFNTSLKACHDESMSLDHRDPTHPLYNVYKSMFELRTRYPALNDGWTLTQFSNQSSDTYLPGSGNVPTEFGLWSVARSRARDAQDFTNVQQGNQTVWLVYSNSNISSTYEFDCSSTLIGRETQALLSPFDANTTVKNLLYPYDEYMLEESTYKLGEYMLGSDDLNGCLSTLEMRDYGFKAFVPVDAWLKPSPRLTKFLPGHDFRYVSTGSDSSTESVQIQLHFSDEMNCSQVIEAMYLESITISGVTAELDLDTVQCQTIPPSDISSFEAVVPSVWILAANLTNVSHGIHTLSIRNASDVNGTQFTNANDKLMFRIGSLQNPMVFPSVANYSSNILKIDEESDSLYIIHDAAGAEKFRYTLDWGYSWSKWQTYDSNRTLAVQDHTWEGTDRQKWHGTHVKVQYWGAGSSSHIQEGDLDPKTGEPARRWPHLFIHGPYNSYGYDAGIYNTFKQDVAGFWNFNLMTEWPVQWQANVWGMNLDSYPDNTGAYGDVDGDQVLDRLPPVTLEENVANLTDAPPRQHLAWWIHISDADLRYYYIPIGSATQQMVLYVLLFLIPPVTGVLAVYAYIRSFYQVKHNRYGILDKGTFISISAKNRFHHWVTNVTGKPKVAGQDIYLQPASAQDSAPELSMTQADVVSSRRMLIATMEYDIPDWEIKIKIGGLGVISQLMGKNLPEHELIWVVPCVGGIEYPVDTAATPISVTVFGKEHDVDVQHHQVNNITYVLLDAPIFRGQTKAEPYPARMDDLESATYYSAWNQCIAECIRRFDPDIYHINDYHGAVAPLYLLPKTIPCALSLHNAEFQGLWPLRTKKEMDEICAVFNLPQSVVSRYVQLGSVFNLLHAGANILRLHQAGFGAVGVSKKYGKRALARYPIFWGLNKIGGLPNPDPTDLAELTPNKLDFSVAVDAEYEASRAKPRLQAQKWAGLEEMADAELFVFVGRWSMQKGIDLIADVFPALLDENPKVQLICIGPVIDLYGKFAALKLAKMMEKYPGRVFSRPEFTALPPYIFSGAEFALIPSRDEPFGLVAVEFGRQGALACGSRVGGLGQMPGWWFTVETATTQHLLVQLKQSIRAALASKAETRAQMRAVSAKQRFPVLTWKRDLNILQVTCIEMHNKHAKGMVSPFARMWRSRPGSAMNTRPSTPVHAPLEEEDLSFPQATMPPLDLTGTNLDLGSAAGPGHQVSSSMDHDDLSIYDGDITRPSSLRSFDAQSPPQQSISQRIDWLPPSGLSSSLDPPTPMSTARMGLSLENVLVTKSDSELQKVEPNFTDPTGMYYRKFESQLESLNAKNSDSTLSVEKFLVNSEKQWYRRFHDAKMGSGVRVSEVPFSGISTPDLTRPSSLSGHHYGVSNLLLEEDRAISQFALPEDYKRPTGVRKILIRKIGDWPLYAFLVALGQIIGANSYQIVLLTGEIGSKASKLYAIAAIYCGSSIFWWLIFRRFQSRYVLSAPWALYGLAFLLIGIGPWANEGSTRIWLQNVAAGVYSAASSSSAFFFSLNFGSEGSATVKSWGNRASALQGIQQIYIAILWYFGSRVTAASSHGFPTSNAAFFNGVGLTGVTVPITIVFWAIGCLLYIGLPDYYRQIPGKSPSFYRSITHRRVVLWFFLAVAIQNLFMSAVTGRNWTYLWSSKHAPAWAVALLVAFFFILVWGLWLYGFAHISSSHPWMLPVYAIGLGAPRWAQILWATSGMGTWVPWAGGNFVASALVGRVLWLWLGVLDSIQGVGFGMILLQTLTRMHMAFALIASQAIGAVFTIVARASVTEDGGPGLVFPNFLVGRWTTGNATDDWGWGHGLHSSWFWSGLISQLVICVGFFMFFRKEQLQKP